MMSGKALPPRPGSGSDGYSTGMQAQYGGSLRDQQNGYEENNPRLAGKPLLQNGRSQNGANPYSGAVALEGYKQEITDGFAGSKPRHNPVSTRTPCASVRLIRRCNR
jgi:hypothetical protein